MPENNVRTGWLYRETEPPNDDACFENMSRIILKGSLNWQFIEDRWKAFRRAFEDFNIDTVSDFDEEDLEILMSNTKIIRSRARIEAVLYNAIVFQEIIQEFGSFRNFIDNLDTTDNYIIARQELSRRFERINEDTAAIFLYSIGENIELSKPI